MAGISRGSERETTGVVPVVGVVSVSLRWGATCAPNDPEYAGAAIGITGLRIVSGRSDLAYAPLPAH